MRYDFWMKHDIHPHGHMWLLNTVTLTACREEEKNKCRAKRRLVTSIQFIAIQDPQPRMNSIQHIDELVKEYLLVIHPAIPLNTNLETVQ